MIARSALFIGALLACCYAVSFGGESNPLQKDKLMITNPVELWQGYDPRKEPLDEEILKERTENGVRYKEFYFTSETAPDGKARLYAIYAAPVGAKNLPALLHIHGGGQTAYTEWLKFWTARGYAAMTFNWGGYWDNRERYALYPKSLDHCNHFRCGARINSVHPTPRDSSWFHWDIASRRALTALEREPEVDPNRLGIFGISMGGTIAWRVAAVDDRVKASCAIYGVGYDTYPFSKYAPDPKAADPDTAAWRRTMEDQVYAPLLKTPILFLNATNDQHGRMDWSFETLKATAGEWRVAYTPQFRHHIAERQGKGLPLWMDTWLKNGPAWPKTPAIKVSLGTDGVPFLAIRPDAAEEVTAVEAFYCIENACPLNRHWRTVRVEKKGDTWTASMPIIDAKQRLFAFANVTYARGMCLTGNFEAVVPAELGKAKATDKPSLQLSDFTAGLDDFLTWSTGTDPVTYTRALESAKAADGRPCLRLLQQWPPIVTYKTGDPKWLGPDGAKLAFDVLCPEPVELTITFHECEFDEGWKKYVRIVSLPAGAGWQTVALNASECKSDKAESLANWRDVNCFEIRVSKAEKQLPMFSDFHWITK